MLTINCYNDSTGLPLSDGTVVSIYHVTDTVGVSTPLLSGTLSHGGKFSTPLFLAGGQYLAHCSDTTYVDTLFYMYPYELYTVINFRTAAGQNTGGGGGSGNSSTTQVVAACYAVYSDDSGTTAGNGTGTPLCSPFVTCTVEAGAGLGVDSNSSQCPQITAYNSAIPSGADTLRFELNLIAQIVFLPPGVGGYYPATEVYCVSLGCSDWTQSGVAIGYDDCFSDTVQVSSANATSDVGVIGLTTKFVAYTNITSTPYIDFMPYLTVISTNGDPFQISEVEIGVEATVLAFKSVSS